MEYDRCHLKIGLEVIPDFPYFFFFGMRMDSSKGRLDIFQTKPKSQCMYCYVCSAHFSLSI